MPPTRSPWFHEFGQGGVGEPHSVTAAVRAFVPALGSVDKPSLPVRLHVLGRLRCWCGKRCGPLDGGQI